MGRREEFGTGADHGREIDLTDGPPPGSVHGGIGVPPRVSGTVHLPPTPDAMEQLTKLVGQHREDVRQDKAKSARESDQNEKAKASPYGLGGNKALRKHLADKHELYPEDAAEMEHPHHYHRLWHTMGEYNPDGHTH